VLADQKTAVVSDPDRDRVYVVDLVGHRRSAIVTLEPGAEPGRLVEDGDGRVHLALRGAGAVLTIDPRDGKTLARRALCSAPRGLAFEPATQLLHVACAGGELVSVAPLAEKPTRTVQLERDLRDELVQGDHLLVSTFRTSELLVVGGAGIIQRAAPLKTQAVFSFGGKFGGMRPLPPGTGTGLEPDASPAVAYRMVPGPGDTIMMVHQRGMDSQVGTQPAATATAPPAPASSSRRSPLSAAWGPPHRQVQPGMASTVLPVDMAISPDGQALALVAAGHHGSERQLQFFSMSDVMNPPMPGQPCIDGGTVPPPGGGGMMPPPTDMPPPIDYRPPNGDVVAVAFDGAGNILVQTREPSATLQILTQRAAPIVLADDSRADLGTSSSTRPPAAARLRLCHAEGAEDGRNWTFAGIGPRRTQSLRGGVMDTAPFHWNGELRNFES
jgi:hypothetical protein